MAEPDTSPLQFFSHLSWIDGKPLLEVLEPFLQHHLAEALSGKYNRALYGAAKKNYKTSFVVLATAYRFFVLESPQGNDSYLIANDQDQAADDLTLFKKLIHANPILYREVEIQKNEIQRVDGRGTLKVLPGQDVIGMHGKTYLTCAYDEIHGYRDYSQLEAMAPDPSRADCMEVFASYASIHHRQGAPLHDLLKIGQRGDDPRMYFAWYSSSYTTDPDFEDFEAWRRANPSQIVTEQYIEQQKKRLPSHKYRRLHLNEPGMPDGTALDAEAVMSCIIEGRKRLKPQSDVTYSAFVDMSGGSNDDAVLGIAHHDGTKDKAVLDLIIAQTGTPPFNPRDAVTKFANMLKQYGIYTVTGDRYAGETFRQDFLDHGIRYRMSPLTKHQLYEAIEPKLNSGEVELLDTPKLQEQLLGLVWRGRKIDHQPGDHDDHANACAGALHEVSGTAEIDFRGGVVIGRELESIKRNREEELEHEYYRQSFEYH